jgi:hypothetical protein
MGPPWQGFFDRDKYWNTDVYIGYDASIEGLFLAVMMFASVNRSGRVSGDAG